MDDASSHQSIRPLSSCGKPLKYSFAPDKDRLSKLLFSACSQNYCFPMPKQTDITLQIKLLGLLMDLLGENTRLAFGACKLLGQELVNLLWAAWLRHSTLDIESASF